MERHHGWAGLAAVLTVALCGCGVHDEPVKPAGKSATPAAKHAPSAAAPDPQTPADFLALARKAMAKEPGWTFAVTGKEGVTLQGQGSNASFRGTLQHTRKPQALHSKGATLAKGTTKSEEIYVLDGTAYLKEGNGAWKKKPASDPEIRNKVEDPLTALDRFGAYLKASEDDVTVTKGAGIVTLQVGVDTTKLTDVRDRGFVQKAMQEFDSTAKQLRKAGVAVQDSRLSFSSLKETLVLDSATYRVESHRFRFQLRVPYQGKDIFYGQDVREENKGAFDREVKLPAGLT
jgi:hypothetical protein